MYYLQSRYYDPAIGRFVNADGYASTGQGVVGCNMFTYCGNGPIANKDMYGYRYVAATRVGEETSEERSIACQYQNSISRSITETKRDVTSEIAVPLNAAVDRARKLDLFSELTNEVLGGALIYPEFYNLVNHNAPWDIKRPIPWTNTIGTEYPGYNVEVSFCGTIMTPESLGNFTYGYLGHEYGIPYLALIAGSYYAAGFPTSEADLANEINDWGYISKGYLYAKIKYLEGY